MGQIALQVPQTGQPNSTEDVKIASNFTTLATLVNGNIDTNNLSPTAAIKYSQLAVGAWQNLTLSAGVSSSGASGGYTPAVRVEGDVARLCGVLQNTSGATIAAGTIIFSVPAAAKPASNVAFSAVQAAGGAAGAVIESIVTTGSAVLSTAGPGWIAGDIIPLDSLVYRLL